MIYPERHPLCGFALGYYLSPFQGFGLNCFRAEGQTDTICPR